MFLRSLRGFVAATALLALATTVVDAQMSTASRFGVSGGLSLPMGDFGDVADMGFQFGGQYQAALGERLKLRLNVDYSMYGAAVGSGDISLLGGMANIVMPIPSESNLKAYLLGGIGMTRWEVSGGGGSIDDTELAFNFGAGYDFEMGGRNWFTELKYVSVQSDGSSLDYLPIVLGFRF